ncbi:MAG: hypothetical protein QNL04_03995 [SAR324 cluster bacterium]|nr:hypothetical protein [SAR324 cluster bacterium]
MQFLLLGLVYLGGLFASQMISFDNKIDGMPTAKPILTQVKTLQNGDKVKRMRYKTGQTCVVIESKKIFACLESQMNQRKLPTFTQVDNSQNSEGSYFLVFTDDLKCEVVPTAITCAFPTVDTPAP